MIRIKIKRNSEKIIIKNNKKLFAGLAITAMESLVSVLGFIHSDDQRYLRDYRMVLRKVAVNKQANAGRRVAYGCTL
jgi:hypothetical protein